MEKKKAKKNKYKKISYNIFLFYNDIICMVFFFKEIR